MGAKVLVEEYKPGLEAVGEDHSWVSEHSGKALCCWEGSHVSIWECGLTFHSVGSVVGPWSSHTN